MISKEMLLLIAGAALATYFTRFPLMILSEKVNFSPKMTKFMSFIAPAVLTSLIVPVIFIQDGVIWISPANMYIPASIITVLVAYYTRNMLASVVTGIISVALLMVIF